MNPDLLTEQDAITPAAPQDESALAERLKALRLQRGWTQGQAGKASGISTSTLSKIENGLMSPTYEVLLRLAHGLGVDIAELFSPAQAHMGAGRRSIERSGDGKLHETPLYRHRLLCAQLSHKRMMPFVSRIKPQAPGHEEEWSRHEGEEFLYVLSGAVELHTEYYQPEVLRAGDCFYIDSRMLHRVINRGRDEAEVLWVSTSAGAAPRDPGNTGLDTRTGDTIGNSSGGMPPLNTSGGTPPSGKPGSQPNAGSSRNKP